MGRERKLLIAVVLPTAMMVVEVFGGWWSGSLALLADAGHMLVDCAALMLALFAIRMARRPADARRTYGYGRMEVLAGFVNALTQFVLVGFIAYEAIERLFKPVEILSGVMLGVAIAGLLVNLIVLRSLHGHSHDDVNIGAASLHVLGDLLGSVGAIVAALLVRWITLDPGGIADFAQCVEFVAPLDAHPARRCSGGHGHPGSRNSAAWFLCFDPRRASPARVAACLRFTHGNLASGAA